VLLSALNAPVGWSKVTSFIVKDSFLAVVDLHSKFFLRLYSTAYVLSLTGLIVFWVIEKWCLRRLENWRDDERIWIPKG